MIKKLKYLGIMSLLSLILTFQKNPIPGHDFVAYAAPEGSEIDMAIGEDSYYGEDGMELPDVAESETDEFGLSDKEKEEEFGDDEISEMESEEGDTDNETIVTINFNVQFDFDTKENPVFLVQVDIPLGLENAEGEESHELINLTDRENFSKSYTMNIYSDLIEMIGHVNGDNAMLYNIEFENIEKNNFFGDEIRNSGVIKNVTNGQTYDVTLIITENPNAKIKSPNDVVISEDYKRIVSGEYGESRAAELEEAESKEEKPGVELDDPEKLEENHKNFLLIVIGGIGITLIVFGAYLFVKKIREDEEY